MVNLFLTEFVLFGFFIWLAVRESNHPDAPIAWLVTGAICGGLLLPVLLYPFSRLLWAAIHLVTEPIALDEIVGALDAVSDRPDDDHDGEPHGCGLRGSGPPEHR